MCRRVIEHWVPCGHQRLMYTLPCDTARGTPGLSYDNCNGGENSFIEKPSSSPCPVCQRQAAFNQHIDHHDTTLPNINPFSTSTGSARTIHEGAHTPSSTCAKSVTSVGRQGVSPDGNNGEALTPRAAQLARDLQDAFDQPSPAPSNVSGNVIPNEETSETAKDAPTPATESWRILEDQLGRRLPNL